jgi:hypothetical protein
MNMPDGNSAALRQYEYEQDRLEREAPMEHEIHEKQSEMLFNRLHDYSQFLDALDATEWGDRADGIAQAIHQHMTAKVVDRCEVGRLLCELVKSRLEPSESDAEYAIREGLDE